jgi:hypothetical protein
MRVPITTPSITRPCSTRRIGELLAAGLNVAGIASPWCSTSKYVPTLAHRPVKDPAW